METKSKKGQTTCLRCGPEDYDKQKPERVIGLLARRERERTPRKRRTKICPECSKAGLVRIQDAQMEFLSEVLGFGNQAIADMFGLHPNTVVAAKKEVHATMDEFPEIGTARFAIIKFGVPKAFQNIMRWIVEKGDTEFGAKLSADMLEKCGVFPGKESIQEKQIDYISQAQTMTANMFDLVTQMIQEAKSQGKKLPAELKDIVENAEYEEVEETTKE